MTTEATITTHTVTISHYVGNHSSGTDHASSDTLTLEQAAAVAWALGEVIEVEGKRVRGGKRGMTVNMEYIVSRKQVRQAIRLYNAEHADMPRFVPVEQIA